MDQFKKIEPNKHVLKLNFDYNPIEVCSWKKAIKLIIKGRAHAIAKGVIRLLRYIQLPYGRIVEAKPSRNGILQRDGHRCQYCGSEFNLTIDHVIPLSKGGQDTWENLVTACLSCNNMKGSKDISSSGLVLHTKPRAPFNKMKMVIEQSNNDEWKQFLYV